MRKLLLALLLVSVAHAEDVTLSWVNATEMEDGTPIPATGPLALDFTSIFWGICDQAGGIVPPRIENAYPPSAVGAVITIDVAGQYCFLGFHTNNSSDMSGPSNAVTKTVAGEPAEPVPPVTLPDEPALASFGPASTPTMFANQAALQRSEFRWQIHVIVNAYPLEEAGLASRDESGMTLPGHLTVWVLPDGRVKVRMQEVAGTMWPGQTEESRVLVSTGIIPLNQETVVTISAGPGGLKGFIGTTLEFSDPHASDLSANGLPLQLAAACTGCPSAPIRDPLDGTVTMHVFATEVDGAAPIPPPEPTPPLPPVLIVVPNDLTVFTIIKQIDKFFLLPVGTVPEGTECDPEQRVNGHFAVPRDVVIWSGTIQPAVVVANCS